MRARTRNGPRHDRRPGARERRDYVRGLAAVVGNRFWGRFTDRSSDREVMMAAGSIATFAAILAAALLLVDSASEPAYAARQLVSNNESAAGATPWYVRESAPAQTRARAAAPTTLTAGR